MCGVRGGVFYTEVCVCMLCASLEVWQATVGSELWRVITLFKKRNPKNFPRHLSLSSHGHPTGFSLADWPVCWLQLCMTQLCTHTQTELSCLAQLYSHRDWFFRHASIACTHTLLPLSGVIKCVRMQSWPTTKQALMSQAQGVGTVMAKIGGLANKRRGR